MFPLPLNQGIYQRIDVIPNETVAANLFDRIMDGIDPDSFSLSDIDISYNDEVKTISLNHDFSSIDSIEIQLTPENKEMVQAINRIGAFTHAYVPSWIWSNIENFIDRQEEELLEDPDYKIPYWATMEFMDQAFPKWARFVADRLPKKYRYAEKCIQAVREAFQKLSPVNKYFVISCVIDPFTGDNEFLVEPFIEDEINMYYSNYDSHIEFSAESPQQIDNCVNYIRAYIHSLLILQRILQDDHH